MEVCDKLRVLLDLLVDLENRLDSGGFIETEIRPHLTYLRDNLLPLCMNSDFSYSSKNRSFLAGRRLFDPEDVVEMCLNYLLVSLKININQDWYVRTLIDLLLIVVPVVPRELLLRYPSILASILPSIPSSSWDVVVNCLVDYIIPLVSRFIVSDRDNYSMTEIALALLSTITDSVLQWQLFHCLLRFSPDPWSDLFSLSCTGSPVSASTIVKILCALPPKIDEKTARYLPRPLVLPTNLIPRCEVRNCPRTVDKLVVCVDPGLSAILTGHIPPMYVCNVCWDALPDRSTLVIPFAPISNDFVCTDCAQCDVRGLCISDACTSGQHNKLAAFCEQCFANHLAYGAAHVERWLPVSAAEFSLTARSFFVDTLVILLSATESLEEGSLVGSYNSALCCKPVPVMSYQGAKSNIQPNSPQHSLSALPLQGLWLMSRFLDQTLSLFDSEAVTAVVNALAVSLSFPLGRGGAGGLGGGIGEYQLELTMSWLKNAFERDPQILVECLDPVESRPLCCNRVWLLSHDMLTSFCRKMSQLISILDLGIASKDLWASAMHRSLSSLRGNCSTPVPVAQTKPTISNVMAATSRSGLNLEVCLRCLLLVKAEDLHEQLAFLQLLTYWDVPVAIDVVELILQELLSGGSPSFVSRTIQLPCRFLEPGKDSRDHGRISSTQIWARGEAAMVISSWSLALLFCTDILRLQHGKTQEAMPEGSSDVWNHTPIPPLLFRILGSVQSLSDSDFHSQEVVALLEMVSQWVGTSPETLLLSSPDPSLACYRSGFLASLKSVSSHISKNQEDNLVPHMFPSIAYLLYMLEFMFRVPARTLRVLATSLQLVVSKAVMSISSEHLVIDHLAGTCLISSLWTLLPHSESMSAQAVACLLLFFVARPTGLVPFAQVLRRDLSLVPSPCNFVTLDRLQVFIHVVSVDQKRFSDQAAMLATLCLAVLLGLTLHEDSLLCIRVSTLVESMGSPTLEFIMSSLVLLYKHLAAERLLLVLLMRRWFALFPTTVPLSAAIINNLLAYHGAHLENSTVPRENPAPGKPSVLYDLVGNDPVLGRLFQLGSATDGALSCTSIGKPAAATKETTGHHLMRLTFEWLCSESAERSAEHAMAIAETFNAMLVNCLSSGGPVVRKSTVCRAFLFNIANVLDRHVFVGTEFLPFTLNLLSGTCILAVGDAGPSGYVHTLAHLSPSLRQCWMNALLVILQKYNMDSYTDTLRTLVQALLFTVYGHTHYLRSCIPLPPANTASAHNSRTLPRSGWHSTDSDTAATSMPKSLSLSMVCPGCLVFVQQIDTDSLSLAFSCQSTLLRHHLAVGAPYLLSFFILASQCIPTNEEIESGLIFPGSVVVVARNFLCSTTWHLVPNNVLCQMFLCSKLDGRFFDAFATSLRDFPPLPLSVVIKSVINELTESNDTVHFFDIVLRNLHMFIGSCRFAGSIGWEDVVPGLEEFCKRFRIFFQSSVDHNIALQFIDLLIQCLGQLAAPLLPIFLDILKMLLRDPSISPTIIWRACDRLSGVFPHNQEQNVLALAIAHELLHAVNQSHSAKDLVHHLIISLFALGSFYDIESLCYTSDVPLGKSVVVPEISAVLGNHIMDLVQGLRDFKLSKQNQEGNLQVHCKLALAQIISIVLVRSEKERMKNTQRTLLFLKHVSTSINSRDMREKHGRDVLFLCWVLIGSVNHALSCENKALLSCPLNGDTIAATEVFAISSFHVLLQDYCQTDADLVSSCLRRLLLLLELLTAYFNVVLMKHPFHSQIECGNIADSWMKLANLLNQHQQRLPGSAFELLQSLLFHHVSSIARLGFKVASDIESMVIGLQQRSSPLNPGNNLTGDTEQIHMTVPTSERYSLWAKELVSKLVQLEMDQVMPGDLLRRSAF